MGDSRSLVCGTSVGIRGGSRLSSWTGDRSGGNGDHFWAGASLALPSGSGAPGSHPPGKAGPPTAALSLSEATSGVAVKSAGSGTAASPEGRCPVLRRTVATRVAGSEPSADRANSMRY